MKTQRIGALESDLERRRFNKEEREMVLMEMCKLAFQKILIEYERCHS